MTSPKPAMIRPRPKSIAELRQLQRDLYELSKPFVRAKSDVYSVSLPTITYWPNGKFTTEYDEWTSNQLAEIDRLWLEARNHFCTVNGLDLPELKDTDNG